MAHAKFEGVQETTTLLQSHTSNEQIVHSIFSGAVGLPLHMISKRLIHPYSKCRNVTLCHRKPSQWFSTTPVSIIEEYSMRLSSKGS
jgi:hypothetical protein